MSQVVPIRSEATESIPRGPINDGSVNLNTANDFKQVPGTIPAADYRLTVSLEIENGNVRFLFQDGGTASSTNGLRPLAFTQVDMPGGQALWFASSDTGDRVNWITQEFV